jgi:hypothetical protein
MLIRSADAVGVLWFGAEGEVAVFDSVLGPSLEPIYLTFWDLEPLLPNVLPGLEAGSERGDGKLTLWLLSEGDAGGGDLIGSMGRRGTPG